MAPWHESFFAHDQQRKGSIAMSRFFRRPFEGTHRKLRTAAVVPVARVRRVPAGQDDPDLFVSAVNPGVNSGAWAAVNGPWASANRFTRQASFPMMDSVIHSIGGAAATYLCGAKVAGSFFAF